MIIALIWAMDRDGVIGIENRLPWKLPVDMQWFRRHTLGKPIVMGRKTFESFGAKPLPQRTNIVVTTDKGYQAAEGVVVAHSIEDALQQAEPAAELMVIGGSSFYQQLLPQADRLYVTRVDGNFVGDAWFPAIDWQQWHLVNEERSTIDAKNSYACQFCIYEPILNSNRSGIQ